MATTIQRAAALGHSFWYDNLKRSMLTSGSLKKMIDDEGLLGMTSNPSIFEKSIGTGNDYDEQIKDILAADSSVDDIGVFWQLAIRDIQGACDAFRPTYERTKGVDGYVSLEVSPRLARDTQGTTDEAKKLFAAVARPNVMIKIPGTPEGVPAIRASIAEGININTTLLFSIDSYLAAADAYLGGLEDRVKRGEGIAHISGVASFFLSRIDVEVDKRLEGVPAIRASIAEGININTTLLFSIDSYLAAADAYLSGLEDRVKRGEGIAHISGVASFFLSRIDSEVDKRLEGKGHDELKGKAAIANAKLAYAKYQELMKSDRWRALAEKGARPQRLLWASTSTKNPAYPKLMYADALIGADTVDTVPAETYDEFLKHGTPAETLPQDLAGAKAQLAALEAAGVSLKSVTDKLLADGVAAFMKSFDGLLAAVKGKRGPGGGGGGGGGGGKADFGDAKDSIASAERDWGGKIGKLWAKDASVWTNHDEGQWLGWLDAVEAGRAHLAEYQALADGVKADGLTDAIVLGMGGSSLCPWLFTQAFGSVLGAPKLHVLDSILPAQVLAADQALDLRKTLFIVSSKSGSTTEPNVMLAYFLDRVTQSGVSDPGKRFVAITDPGSKLEKVARDAGFRAIIHGEPSIGGRYSALSPFGLVPAAIMGLDVARLLDGAAAMATACKHKDGNPGVQLGAAMGTLAKRGRDKLTIVAHPKLKALGAWLEQLIAESTGKHGTGVVPVDGELLAAPSVYGNDRFFVYVPAKGGEPDPQEKQLDELAAAGHPVMRLDALEPYDLGAAFFQWEIAVAVAGAILGIDPFDQPDVEASKNATRRILAAGGPQASGEPLANDGRLALFTDAQNAAAIGGAGSPTVNEVLANHVARIKAGDYVAFNAYVPMFPEHDQALQNLRNLVRDRRHVATTVGYGPRFLHSTGQLHKGGPNSGVFLQLTCDSSAVVPIPGEPYDFGTLARAQPQGDFEVLAERNRRALRVHLGADVAAGLAALTSYLTSILAQGA